MKFASNASHRQVPKVKPWLTLIRVLMALLCISFTGGCHPSPSKSEGSSEATSREAESKEALPNIIPTNYKVTSIAHHTHCCDGSAGVALDERHFLVANDENSILRIYPRGEGSKPIDEVNVRKFLDLKKKDDESDLEGMTRIGNRVFVIASHARSKDGDKRKGRRQLFALNYTNSSGTPGLTPYGEPYTKLLKDLENSYLFEGVDFDAAAKKPGDDRDGLNIEGLTSTPDGGLMIGFRHPIHQGATLLVTIQNPEEVVLGEKPRFSKGLKLLLGGMGIRGLERHHSTYFLTTESTQGKRYPQIFAWNGVDDRPKRIFATLPKDLNPESILVFPDTGTKELHILSDDGNEKIAGDPCNEIDEKEDRSFRRVVLKAAP